MKATAQAPANIAFIKYWGKKNEELRLPLNSSISMNLSEAYTTTTVEFSKDFKKDEVTLVTTYSSSDPAFIKDHKSLAGESRSLNSDGSRRSLSRLRRDSNNNDFSTEEKQRIIAHLDLIRQRAKINDKARVVTKNSFPRGSGIASSASGFAALTVAACAAVGLKLSEKELTILARLGSGSACRSIPDGFVIWEEGLQKGQTLQGLTFSDSYAYSLYPASYWDLRDILVIVESRMKKVATSEGMGNVITSPFLSSRIKGIPAKITQIKKALETKNMQLLGEVMEEECLNMHAVAQSQEPPINYWNTATIRIMESVVQWRNSGLPIYFTIDAGPNVHLICEAKDKQMVLGKLKMIRSIESIIVNKPAKGAYLTDNHLF